MAKKNEDIKGQMTIFDFCTEPSYEVVQSNRVINGKQSLGLNSAKLIRSAIMQIKPEDKELKAYKASIPELAKMFGTDRKDLHRDIKNIAKDIRENPLKLQSGSGDKEKWIEFPWISFCGYDPEEGVIIRLNDCLRPLLVQLKENYTQYYLESILTMRSVYSIRIFELIQAKIYSKTIPKKGTEVYLSVAEIRQACDIVGKYKSYTSFKDYVIDKAVNEINKRTYYQVSYKDCYEGKKIVGYDFKVTMNYMKNLT